jgi:hypothetical protein
MWQKFSLQLQFVSEYWIEVVSGKHGREEKWFWWESQKERGHLEDQGVDGRMESEWILGRMAGVA